MPEAHSHLSTPTSAWAFLCLPRRGSSSPQPPLLFLESQAPGKPRGHLSIVPAVISSGRRMPRAGLASVCLLRAVGLRSHVVGLNGLPEAAETSNFVKGFFSMDESVCFPQIHAQSSAEHGRVRPSPDSGRSQRLLEKPVGSQVLGSLAEKVHWTWTWQLNFRRVGESSLYHEEKVKASSKSGFPWSQDSLLPGLAGLSARGPWTLCGGGACLPPGGPPWGNLSLPALCQGGSELEGGPFWMWPQFPASC